VKTKKGPLDRDEARFESGAPTSRGAESGTRQKGSSREIEHAKLEPFLELRIRGRERRVSHIAALQPKVKRAWFAPSQANLDLEPQRHVWLLEIFEVYFALG
jgi:hypothetical protein